MNTLALKQEASERLYACELSLISKVKEHPHLYDFNHRDYKDTQKCIQTWFNIAQELGIRPEKWSVCKERWRTLRDVYVRNRKCYLMGGERARKRNKWKYFDEMNFLHPYINHRAFEAEKDAHDNRILWQNIKQSDTESDSDSNEAAPFGQQRTTISPNIEAQVLNSSLKRELSEEDEEGEKNTKGLLLDEEISDNLRRYLKPKSAAVEELEALLLQDADPLAVTMNGQHIKQEVEWSDDETDMQEKVLKPLSPSASPPIPPLPSPVTPPPGKDKKTVMFNLKLPSGKSIPATFVTDPKAAFTKTIRMTKPTPLNSVPIKIKTVTGDQVRASVSQSSLMLSSLLPKQPPPLLQEDTPTLKKENRDSTPRTSRSPTPCTEQVYKTVRQNVLRNPVIEDEEELYGKYVAAAMRKLTSRSRSLAKMRIQQVLFHLEESDRACD